MQDFVIAGLFLSGFIAVVFTALYFNTLRDSPGRWREYKLKEYGTIAAVSWILVCLILSTWMASGE